MSELTFEDRLRQKIWDLRRSRDLLASMAELNRKDFMKTVNVNREVLLNVVKGNYERHKIEVGEAKEMYQRALDDFAYAYTSWIRSKAELGDLVVGDFYTHQPQYGLVIPKEPEDHTDEYKQVIDLLEFSVDQTIGLEARDFDAFVRDEWDWKHTYCSINSVYSASLRSKMGK